MALMPVIEYAVHVCTLQSQVPNTQNILMTVKVPRVHFIEMDTVLIHVVLQRQFHKLRGTSVLQEEIQKQSVDRSICERQGGGTMLLSVLQLQSHRQFGTSSYFEFDILDLLTSVHYNWKVSPRESHALVVSSQTYCFVVELVLVWMKEDFSTVISFTLQNPEQVCFLVPVIRELMAFVGALSRYVFWYW